MPGYPQQVENFIEVQLWGIQIQEPITALTDLLITAVCWYIFIKLRPLKERSRVYRLFRSFFFMMGLATLLGGIFGHAGD